MEFFDLYNSFESSYEIGMGIEVKEYISSSTDVIDYKINLINNEINVIINYKGKSVNRFVYDFLCFISYDYFCLVHKEETQEKINYYIYTKMSEEITGIKIKLVFLK